MPKSRPPTSKVVADQQDSGGLPGGGKGGGHHNGAHHQGGKRMQAGGAGMRLEGHSKMGLQGTFRSISGEVTLAIASRGQICLNQDVGKQFFPDLLKAVYSRPGLVHLSVASQAISTGKERRLTQKRLSMLIHSLSKSQQTGPRLCQLLSRKWSPVHVEEG